MQSPDANISPSADEYCDGIDNNCDNTIDGPSSIDAQIFFVDADTDGFGSSISSLLECSTPSGYVENADDCDDSNSKISPNADEYCDDIDNNCDGNIDESGSFGESDWFVDQDADGFGSIKDVLTMCDQPVGYVAKKIVMMDCILSTKMPLEFVMALITIVIAALILMPSMLRLGI